MHAPTVTKHLESKEISKFMYGFIPVRSRMRAKPVAKSLPNNRVQNLMKDFIPNISKLSLFHAEGEEKKIMKKFKVTKSKNTKEHNN